MNAHLRGPYSTPMELKQGVQRFEETAPGGIPPANTVGTIWGIDPHKAPDTVQIGYPDGRIETVTREAWLEQNGITPKPAAGGPMLPYNLNSRARPQAGQQVAGETPSPAQFAPKAAQAARPAVAVSAPENEVLFYMPGMEPYACHYHRVTVLKRTLAILEFDTRWTGGPPIFPGDWGGQSRVVAFRNGEDTDHWQAFSYGMTHTVGPFKICYLLLDQLVAMQQPTPTDLPEGFVDPFAEMTGYPG